ncbi:MAG: UDP-N-acetylmuramoyl-L-alanine--D-glutamate ligase [Legionellaceae bacterium]|nr:UDP-N-acetylmuramoyl-L-alanine--D-glutamate ligase [Legionellaceae bacterium]
MNSALHLVVGLGKTGHSIARYLTRHAKPFVVFDTRTAPVGLNEFQDEFPGIDIFLGDLPQTIFSQLKAVITSPGVALDHPVMQKAIALHIPVYGDIECLAREIDAPVVAITGTNGKSTVTTLVGEMAKADGLSVMVAGNIGQPVLDALANNIHYNLWVLELSSFQLDLTTSLAPIAATILNITPDHLDRHHTFEAYVAAKQRVYHNAQYILYNRDDQWTQPNPRLNINAVICNYGLDEPADGEWGLKIVDGTTYLAYGQDCILPVDAMRIKGRHNWANALAACALAHAAGISIASMKKVLEDFSGLPHRTQWVRSLDGVDWINDSKGTNIGATISAISGLGGSMQGKIVLIAGGQGKGADFQELQPAMAEYVRSLVLIGEDADKLEQALSDVVGVSRAESLEQAIGIARELAKPGDIVLLSPACASLDMFRDYNHRGEVFTAMVDSL